MVSLTGNRKREQYAYTSPPDSHVSKKQKFSSKFQISNQTLGSSNSIVARLSLYPETTAKIRREAHAPCRILKYDRPRIVDNGREKVGNYTSFFFVRRNYVDFVRNLNKEKEIIDVDIEENERRREIGLEGSGVEEDGKGEDLMLLEEENMKEGDLLVLDSKCDDEAVDREDENDVKIVEERSVVTSDGNLVSSMEKMMDLYRGEGGEGWSNIEVYKKLLASAERSGRRLKELEFQIEFNEKKRSIFESWRLSKKPEEKPVKKIPSEPFIPLTEEEEVQINRALTNVNRRKVLVSHKISCIDITGEILQCLRPGQWLNDEVINVYLELLKEREKREPEKFLKCHFFNTFFYKKLTTGHKNIYDYRAVKRWTTQRKLGYFLIDCDKIFVPVHFREMHWCLAIINKKDQKFQYLDSLKARDFKVLKNLAKYYVEEVKDKCNKDIDVSNWEHEFLEDLPQQDNGFDCGVFMIKYADFLSRGLGLCFGQEHMPYFRLRTVKEILRLRAA